MVAATLERGRRLASFAIVVVVVALYGIFLVKYGWQYRDVANVDLPSFYTASLQVFQHGGSPYPREGLQSLSGPETYVYPYLYPPPSVLLFYPMSRLGYDTVRQLTLAVNHAIVLALLWVIPGWLLRGSPGGASVAFGLTALCLLAFQPTVETLNHGQVNLVLLVFLLGFWLLARAGRPVWAALCLALAVLLKTYPIVLLPYLVIAGRKRDCAWTVAWLVLAVVVAAPLLPAGLWADWFTNVLPSGGYMRSPAGLLSPAAIWNHNLNAFFARTLTENEWSHPLFVNPALAQFLTSAAAAGVAVVTGVAVRRGARLDGGLDRMLLVALPAMYLVAPLSWHHQLVYLLPSILLLLTARTRLSVVETRLFYLTSAAMAMVVATDGLWRFTFYAVLVLWALCVFVAASPRVHLTGLRGGPDDTPAATPRSTAQSRP